MTCEVAVMNKRGVALAADSAVTMGNGRKIYNTAEKLFRLSPGLPVAIMTYGSADIMGVPWETVVTIYARKLGDRRFDTLEEYARSFIGFIEESRTLFPPDGEADRVGQIVGEIWRGLYAERLSTDLESAPADADPAQLLADIIDEDHGYWDRYDDLDDLGMAYGAEVMIAHEDVLARVRQEVFDGMALPVDVVARLNRTVAYLFGKEGPFPSESGVVMAGLGEAEPFPLLFEYRVGPIFRGRLRAIRKNVAHIQDSTDAIIVPLAQREIIDLIIDGVHPELAKSIAEQVDAKESANGDAADGDTSNLAAFIRTESQRMHSKPFMQAVSALPRQDLAKLAETLVDLTAFMLRMSADSQETVGGPVDVAVLSKADGFTWVKHKDLAGHSS
jgi:hypothetical protein